MSDPPTPMELDPVPHSHRDEESEASQDESESDMPVDLMVTSRARRSNAGNRMSTLLAKSAEKEEWGEEWEDAPNEEDFQGGDVNEQEDYNMDSSSSEEDDDGGDEDDAGEKELRKAERQEKSKKRKATTNPFAARVASVARKKVKLDVPTTSKTASPSLARPRPKKKSERASWIPTEEDGPVRTSSRKQTVANKETTMAKLKEKDRRRDDTLAIMKAAEARKAKAKEPPLTQAQRLAEAARNERINKKTLHRWEEAEEARAAERQAKIDAIKNRQIEGPCIRFYSGPAIWVDDKIKYTGKDAPTLEELEKKLNQEVLRPEKKVSGPESTEVRAADNQTANSTDTQPQPPLDQANTVQPPRPVENFQSSMNSSYMPPMQYPMSSRQDASHIPWAASSQGADIFMGSHGISHTNNTIFNPSNQDSFLFGIDQYAQSDLTNHTSDSLPPNPFTQASPYQHQYVPTHSPFSQVHAPMDNHHATPNGPAIGPQALVPPYQNPPTPIPPRRKLILRSLRNLLILSSFPALEPLSQSSSARTASIRTAASLLKDKDKDRTALIHLATTLFAWSLTDATSFVTATLAVAGLKAPKKKDTAAPPTAPELAFKPTRRICPVTNSRARYKDPETGMPYRDVRAFGVLRGVVGGGFVWSGELGCFVGGRARPLESIGGKGFLGMPPAKSVPRRFWEMPRKAEAPLALSEASAGAALPVREGMASAAVDGPSEVGVQQRDLSAKMEGGSVA